jgi:sialate O-acetylesterase
VEKTVNKFILVITSVLGLALTAPATMILSWAGTNTAVIGTNLTLHLSVDAQGGYQLDSTENVPVDMEVSVFGITDIPGLPGKSFSLNFSSDNGQDFKTSAVFDSPEEVARITADLTAVDSSIYLTLRGIYGISSVSGYTVGIRNSSGAETTAAINQDDLSAISPSLYGGSSDYLDYRAVSGTAGGWTMLVFDFGSDVAPVRCANIFSSGCVLQRDKTVPVWGTCNPGESVTVGIKNQQKTTVADSNGVWRVELDAEPAGGPYTLTATGEFSAAVVLTDVYFGDVWILTGQSNMAQTLAQQIAVFPSAYSSVPDAADDLDDVRFAMISTVSNSVPATDVSMDQVWARWDKNLLSSMSAIGYFCERYLNQQLDAAGMTNIPLGFIRVCQGGTSIEEWMSQETLSAIESDEPLQLVYPARYYNGMIAPIQDYPIKGVLWYQGENNSYTTTRINQYRLLEQALIESWRSAWGISDMPFYYVQLAPYYAYSAVPTEVQLWAWMRESQSSCLSVSNTAMACIIDSGLQGNIHPPFKDRAGERLARIILSKTYGIPTVCRGPTIENVQLSDSDVILTFGNSAEGLQIRTVDCESDSAEISAGFLPVSVSSNELAGFALCGTDQTFYWATQAEIISSNQVRISNVTDVPSPVAVRYAWHNYPRCNLFNSEGLPAEPFRTDSYGYGASSGADSTPTASGLSNRIAYAAQNSVQVDLTPFFSDIEDGVSNLAFFVSGNTQTNVIEAASVSNRLLTLSFSGAAGSSLVTVTATDSENNAVHSAFEVTVENTTFNAWRYDYFSAEQLNNLSLEDSAWGDMADPDSDGIPNLLEYALASSPTSSNSNLQTVSIVVENGIIKVRYLKSKKVDTDSSITVGVRSVFSLKGSLEWTAIESNDTLYDDLGETELRELEISTVADGSPSQFVRLYVRRI